MSMDDLLREAGFNVVTNVNFPPCPECGQISAKEGHADGCETGERWAREDEENDDDLNGSTGW